MFERHDDDGQTRAEFGERASQPHRSTYVKAALVGLGVSAVLVTIVNPPLPRLLWNASASAPIGLYLITPGAQLEVGDMVAARAPDGARQLAAARGYLPSGVPLVKRIAAVAGSRVCAKQARITVDGRPVAHRNKYDAEGRLVPWWTGCRVLRPRQALLINRAPGSFDSRYFGPVDDTAILGKAVLLWRP